MVWIMQYWNGQNIINYSTQLYVGFAIGNDVSSHLLTWAAFKLAD